MDRTIADIQLKLKEFGMYAGTVDNLNGDQTKAAVRAFQRINSLKVDGIAGQQTIAKLFPDYMPERKSVPAQLAPTPAQHWPRQNDVPSFFGQPGGPEATAGTVTLPFKFRIAWDLNQRVGSYKCHRKVAEAMTGIWRDTVAHYGEARFRELKLDLFGGCYNNRVMRGGMRPSMHAFGIAYDVDPERNQLKWGRDRAQLARPEYEPFWKIVEAAGAVSLGRVANYDWMHFQFARL